MTTSWRCLTQQPYAFKLSLPCELLRCYAAARTLQEKQVNPVKYAFFLSFHVRSVVGECMIRWIAFAPDVEIAFARWTFKKYLQNCCTHLCTAFTSLRTARQLTPCPAPARSIHVRFSRVQKFLNLNDSVGHAPRATSEGGLGGRISWLIPTWVLTCSRSTSFQSDICPSAAPAPFPASFAAPYLLPSIYPNCLYWHDRAGGWRQPASR